MDLPISNHNVADDGDGDDSGGNVWGDIPGPAARALHWLFHLNLKTAPWGRLLIRIAIPPMKTWIQTG